jgi:flagellar biosynthesis protein FlhF
MKIKNFYASDVSRAMREVREILGEGAVIISTRNLDDGRVELTAAVEEEMGVSFDEKDDNIRIVSRYRFDDSAIRDSLDYHCTLDIMRDRILAMVKGISEAEQVFDDRKLLERTFARIFSYKDILETDRGKLKIFMGTPGSGKSTAVAKVATKARIKGLNPCIVSTDNVRAGANKQLEAFAGILEVDFRFVKGGKALFSLLQKAGNGYDLILVDTPGINPFIEEEVEKIREITEALEGDKIMTIDAGRNTFEAVEIAGIFRETGAGLFLPTRLDLTKRIGSCLSVAGCCELGFCAASVSADIARGLASVSSRSLTQLIMS